MQRGRLFYFVITHDRPEEADEFAGYRNDGDVRRFAVCDAVKSLVETTCQRPSKAAQVWPSKIAHLAEVTSL